MSTAHAARSATGQRGWFSSPRAWPLVLLSTSFLLLVLALIWALYLGVTLDVLVRDPIAIAELPVYAGIFSHLGVIAWCATAAVCVFSGIMLLKARVREHGLFLIWSGILTSFLLVDDLFMIHDGLFEQVLGWNELIPVFAYGLLLLWILWRFRETILASKWKLFVAALVLMSLSVLEDIVMVVRGNLHYFIEDGFKFMGIVAWFGYFSRHAYDVCRRELVERRQEAVAEAPSTEAAAMDEPAEARTMIAPAGWRLVRWGAAGMAVLLVGLLIASEPYARYQLGLGDPPLYVADPEIEYLFAPSRTYDRFGNTVSFNSMSMRSDEFTAHKSDPDELRVMVLGDEIVNGGVLTDQQELATAILEDALEQRLDRPVVVGNIAAGGWGASHLLAYADRFGFCDADVVVLVLSSHHQWRVPTFEPRVGVHPSFPDETPILAIQEGVNRYAPVVLGRYLRSPLPRHRSDGEEHESAADERALSALRELIGRGRSSGARVIVAQHLIRDELEEGPGPGQAVIADAAREAGAALIQLGPAYEAAREQGLQLYRDNVNLNQEGQRVLAEVLEQAILEALPEEPIHAADAGHVEP